MKRFFMTTGLVLVSFMIQTSKANAQIPILDIISQGIKKVIIAVDLKVQRLQNETIFLQNAQKALENTMSKLRLEEIGDWVEKQRKLYADYFEELQKVKVALTYYKRFRDILDNQVQLVNEYKGAWALFRQDKRFSAGELEYMEKIYLGIMEESSKNLDQLFLVVNAFVTQMSDGKRLEIINSVADRTSQNLTDLREFNTQNKLISIQRAAEAGEIDYARRLYGLP